MQISPIATMFLSPDSDIFAQVEQWIDDSSLHLLGQIVSSLAFYALLNTFKIGFKLSLKWVGWNSLVTLQVTNLLDLIHIFFCPHV